MTEAERVRCQGPRSLLEGATFSLPQSPADDPQTGAPPPSDGSTIGWQLNPSPLRVKQLDQRQTNAFTHHHRCRLGDRRSEPADILHLNSLR